MGRSPGLDEPELSDYLVAMSGSNKTPIKAPRRTTELRQAIEMRLGRSVRSYRRLLDVMMREAYEGKRAMSDVQKMAQGAKAATELFMTEQLLARGIGDVEFEDHPAGADGGLPEMERGSHRKKIIKFRTGLDRYGARVDDKTVTIETDGDDDGAEDEADADTF